jgi:hypothetical protein
VQKAFIVTSTMSCAECDDRVYNSFKHVHVVKKGGFQHGFEHSNISFYQKIMSLCSAEVEECKLFLVAFN